MAASLSPLPMSNVASSGEQEEGRVSPPPSTSGNAQLIPPEPPSVRCEEVYSYIARREVGSVFLRYGHRAG